MGECFGGKAGGVSMLEVRLVGVVWMSTLEVSGVGVYAGGKVGGGVGEYVGGKVGGGMAEYVGGKIGGYVMGECVGGRLMEWCAQMDHYW